MNSYDIDDDSPYNEHGYKLDPDQIQDEVNKLFDIKNGLIFELDRLKDSSLQNKDHELIVIEEQIDEIIHDAYFAIAGDEYGVYGDIPRTKRYRAWLDSCRQKSIAKNNPVIHNPATLQFMGVAV